jgi:hypothetical protein
MTTLAELPTFAAATRDVSADRRVLRLPRHGFGAAMARRLREEHGRADLIMVEHALADIEQPDEFLAGIPLALAWNGTVIFERPRAVACESFEAMLERNALGAFASDDARVWVCHAADPRHVSARARLNRRSGALAAPYAHTARSPLA